MSCNAPVPTEESLYLDDAAAEQLVTDNGGVVMHLDDFRDKYMTQCGVFFPVRQRSYTYSGGYQVDDKDYTKNNLGWFSIDTIPVGGQQVYIRGRIITDDLGGNFYKSLVIQEMVDGKQQTLRVSVDASSAGGRYQLGQEIMIHVNGLGIGKYANEPQLCVPTYNNNTYAMNAEQKMGWAPGRIPAPRFAAAVTIIGEPDASKIHCDTLQISDFTKYIEGTATNADYFRLDGNLVCLKDVWFTGGYDNYGNEAKCSTGDPEKDSNANVFAPTTNNVGYPQGRLIQDANGNRTLVSTSEYAKFASYYLPGADKNGVANCSEYKGTVVGILGHYTDNGRNLPDAMDWSITLRDFSTSVHSAIVEDLQLTNSAGEKWVPVEYGND